MKKFMSAITAVFLTAAMLAGCAAPAPAVTALPTSAAPAPINTSSPTAATPSPAPASSPSAAQSVTPAPAETEPPEGYIPDDISANGYTPDSASDVYEDEDYIIFKNISGILVFDKNTNETLAVLPRSNTFTYCDYKVYYIDYEADTGKSNITEYSVTSGKEKIIKRMDNTAVSMLAYSGRLYYVYQTDPKDVTATELRSVALGGGDMRIIGAQRIDRYIIKDGFVYYSEKLTMDHSDLNLYKLSLKDGSKANITRLETNRYPFKMIGDTILYPAYNDSIGLYNIKTGNTSYLIIRSSGGI